LKASLRSRLFGGCLVLDSEADWSMYRSCA